MSAPPARTPSRIPRRRPRRTSRGGAAVRRRLIVLVVVGVVVIWTAVAGVQLIRARQHAQDGLDLLRQTQPDLGPAELIRGKGLDRMRAARSEFDQASDAASRRCSCRSRSSRSSAARCGRCDSLTGSAAKVVHVGRRHDGGVDERSSTTKTDGRPGPGRADRASSAPSPRSPRRARRGEPRPEPGARRPAGLGPHEVRRAARQGAQVDDRRRRRVQGHRARWRKGPSKYLVLAANNSEMRAGSGMLLSRRHAARWRTASSSSAR